MGRFLEWLGGTPWSVALLESTLAWPLIESAHVLGVALFFGTVMMNDLRLLGWALRSVPVSEVTGRILPWTRLGFAVMLSTGLLVFYSNPVRYYHNIFFRLKVILFIVAGLNAFLFHRGIQRRVLEWERLPALPGRARLAGAVSLGAWALIVVAGRLIAYNWFDCDIPGQPAWVDWAAGCPAPETATAVTTDMAAALGAVPEAATVVPPDIAVAAGEVPEAAAQTAPSMASSPARPGGA